MDKKQVAEWVKRDLETSIGFLNLVRSTPEIQDYIVDLAFEKIKVKEEQEKEAVSDGE